MIPQRRFHKESKSIYFYSSRIIKAKRSIQSNEDKTSSQSKLQISGSLFSSTVTEAAGKAQDADDKSKAPSFSGLFQNSNQATAGASLFGNTSGGASLFGGTSGFKFQPAATTAAGASSVFSGGSLFGGQGIGAQTTGSLFGGGSLFSQPAAQNAGGLFGNTGGSLFSNNTPLFGGQNAFQAKKANEGDEEGEDSGDDEPQQADDEPPAFANNDDQTKGLIPGVTDKPVKLNIVSKPPEKSPYTKVFNVIFTELICIENCREV